ncbi:hypothetical protein WH47_00550 [Habropoda laboriosa]|uniref:Uncharacterized protein n=1 Tax=Habropoda laboriosa TaxID=597456 RepID=A0A0L7R3W5_9HYME|nr:hypothetical protein WH47_00550 [Habropoda laboriosa]
MLCTVCNKYYSIDDISDHINLSVSSINTKETSSRPNFLMRKLIKEGHQRNTKQ